MRGPKESARARVTSLLIRIAPAIIFFGVLGAVPSARSADITAPTVEHDPCTSFAWGHALVLTVHIEDESPLFDPKVLFRIPPKKRWDSVPLRPTNVPNAYEATIPAEALTSDVEYFVQVFDEAGNGPARVGSTKEPIVVRAAAKFECPGTPSPTPPEPREEVVHEVKATEPGPGDTGPALTTEAPEPAPSGCDGPSPPLWCSPWVWAGAGAILLAGGGLAWWLLSGEDVSSATRADLIVSAPFPEEQP